MLYMKVPNKFNNKPNFHRMYAKCSFLFFSQKDKILGKNLGNPF